MSQQAQNQPSLKKMLGIFLLIAVSGGGLLLYGFIDTQAVRGSYWRDMSKQRKVTELRDPAKRGDIYSSDGKALATTITVCDLYIDLGHRQVRTRDGVVKKDKHGNAVVDTAISVKAFAAKIDTVCMLLHQGRPQMSVAEYKQRIVNERRKAKPSQCFLVAKNIPYTTWLELLHVEGWSRGIIQQLVDDNGNYQDVRHQMRIRIYRSLGANIIGYRNGVSDRYTGLEGYYDSILRGQDGIYMGRRLTRGVWLPTLTDDSLNANGTTQQAKIDGGSITSTIDIRHQDIAENALRQELKRCKARAGCVILMEVETGYVLACANLHKENTDQYNERIDGNIACSGWLQPGSTFKPVIVAAAMSDDSIRIDTAMRLRARVKNFDGTPEGEIIDEHDYGDSMTIAQAIINSSNVAMAELGWQYYRKRRPALIHQVQQVFPSDALYIDLRTFERPQSLSTLKYTRDMTNFCFGYGTAVSPLQLLTFYNAIAANGRMVKPLFCKSITTAEGTTTLRPVVMNSHAFSKKTAKYLQGVLAQVVTDGTAKTISNNSYGIAGKTGTAKLRAQGFSANDAYFVGYFPTDSPKYSCLVLIDSTYGSGGTAAAPVFKKVADGTMALDKDLGRIKLERIEWNTPENSRTPNCKKGYRSDIADSYEQLGIKFPMADSSYRWISYRDGFMPYAPKSNIMPDCTGMTIKDALRLLDDLGITAKFSGCGKVVRQNPKARTPMRKGSTAILELGY
ncbi:MAG: transpeptidase family protein [Bacteroidales bacterium]|nr:transpeptidase family protein [Bacteroidales bacterium]